ncbi:MAG TPA: prepilin-type N-terminal cleavage/methylation domain-containing protein [Planctomycetota bacterium]|nr:prepilin-type N-terminal cleavage/methylation domain-containing protein [Planctomycetota bacterium]
MTSSARGMTLMEVVISMAVLSIGFLLCMQILKSMSDDMYAETTQSEIQKRSSGRIYDMVAELQNIVVADNAEIILGLNLTETNPFAPVTGDLPSGPGIGNSIRFRVVTGVDADGKAVYGGRIRYRWLCSNRETPANGIDDDQNGVIDDGYIAREELDDSNNVVTSMAIEDHVPATVSSATAPYGLTFERKSTNMRELLVTVHRSADQRLRTNNGTTATATFSRKVFLRNP